MVAPQLATTLQQFNGSSHRMKIHCADLMGNLIGSQVGPPDASTNKRYLEEAIVEDFQRGRKYSRR
jgi:hypothetical protein